MSHWDPRQSTSETSYLRPSAPWDRSISARDLIRELLILEPLLRRIEGLVCGRHNVAEGHQPVLDHPDTLNANDQDEGDHEECPDGLELQVVHLDGHNVPGFTNGWAPG